MPTQLALGIIERGIGYPKTEFTGRLETLLKKTLLHIFQCIQNIKRKKLANEYKYNKHLPFSD